MSGAGHILKFAGAFLVGLPAGTAASFAADRLARATTRAGRRLYHRAALAGGRAPEPGRVSGADGVTCVCAAGERTGHGDSR